MMKVCAFGKKERNRCCSQGDLSGAHSCTALTHRRTSSGETHSARNASHELGAHLKARVGGGEEVTPDPSGYMRSTLGWGQRCVFEDWTLRCRSFWWVCSGSGSSTARKPRWTCSRWAPSSPWSGSSSGAAWTPRASSSTAACASFTAGSKRRLSIRTNWKSSSSRLIRTRNTGRTFCRRCHGLRYLSKTGTKR